MKRLLFWAALMAFAVAARAGDPNVGSTGCCQARATAAQAPCCAKGKGAQAKAAPGNKARSQGAAVKKSLQSPKAMSLACR
ncbi:MAG: hypothetical protein ACLQM8_21155 [Limisphaerales bacterium]